MRFALSGIFVLGLALLFTAAYAQMDATTAPVKPGQGMFDGALLGQLDCSNAIPALCPGSVSGQSVEQPNNVPWWLCGFIDPGGELVYAISLQAIVNITITVLNHDEGCIDVYFVEACDEHPCMWIGCQTGDSRTVNDVGPGTVYVVVDRWAGCPAGLYEFQLQFACEQPPPACHWVHRCDQDLGGHDYYADGEWNSRDGLIYQIYHGGSSPAAPDIVVYKPEDCEVVQTYQLAFTRAPQHGIAVDTRSGYMWVAGWWNKVIYYLDAAGNLVHTFGGLRPYAGLAYDPDNERLWAVTNSAPDDYLVFDVHNPLTPTLLWGPKPVPWQCGGTLFGTNFNGAGLEYSPYADRVIFINQDAAAQECFLDNQDGTLTPLGCCQLTPLRWPWGCALIDGELGQKGSLYLSSLDNWPCGPWPVDVFETVCDAPLPVELVSFQATSGDGHILLTWLTASETDNNYFKIYRRHSSAEWIEIARVLSKGEGPTLRYYEYRDRYVRPQELYEYMIADVDNAGVETRATEQIRRAQVAQTLSPAENVLHQNFPNPFNPQTVIRYDVQKAGQVRLRAFDVTGRVVASLLDEYASPGHYSVTFDGTALPSGLYFVVMDAGDFHAAMKVVLTK
ncbi:MAG: T9SS type A sorting domain-containing protein [bacterium]